MEGPISSRGLRNRKHAYPFMNMMIMMIKKYSKLML
jgi:hypothetical protein